MMMVDMMIGLAVLGGVIYFLLPLKMREDEKLSDAVTAQQLQTVRRAAETYMRANWADVLTLAAGGPVAITPAQMRTSSNLIRIPDRNPWLQDYRLLVRQLAPDALDVLLVTSGGRAIPDHRLIPMSRALGADGGFIATSTPTIAQGQAGGWVAQLADFAGTGVVPAPGHLAASFLFTGTDTGTDFLYRVAVPGRPELNEMETTLNMNDNLVDNAHDVVLLPRGKRASQAVYDEFMVSADEIVPKPPCLTGQTPGIYLATLNSAASASGDLFSAIQGWADDNGGSWTVRMRARTFTGYMTPPPGLGVMMANTKCD